MGLHADMPLRPDLFSVEASPAAQTVAAGSSATFQRTDRSVPPVRGGREEVCIVDEITRAALRARMARHCDAERSLRVTPDRPPWTELATQPRPSVTPLMTRGQEYRSAGRRQRSVNEKE
jgi:hypothetical protein